MDCVMDGSAGGGVAGRQRPMEMGAAGMARVPEFDMSGLEEEK